MSPLRRVASMLVLLALLVGVSASPARTTAAGGIQPSDVVLAFDFSASMKEDGKNVDTASALRTLADRIPAYTDDIIKSEITVHLIWFRGDAVAVPGCEVIRLDAQPKVPMFADCLNQIADVYRMGPTEWKRVGDVPGTNYEAAFEKSVELLAEGVTDRPAIIFFTDGEHTGVGGTAPNNKNWLTAIKTNLETLPSKAVLPVGLGVKGAAKAVLTDLSNDQWDNSNSSSNRRGTSSSSNSSTSSSSLCLRTTALSVLRRLFRNYRSLSTMLRCRGR
jgi:hypothetical protein